MQMQHTTPRKSVRIAGFLFIGTAALMAQSPVNNRKPAEAELIALNARAVPYPPAMAPAVPTPDSTGASSEIVSPAQPATPFQASDLVKQASAPGTSTLAMAQDHTASSSRGASSGSWFTAGPDALPTAVRMDPSFSPPSSRYGAAPAAVQFHFGKK
jgi:hypothetical protein